MKNLHQLQEIILEKDSSIKPVWIDSIKPDSNTIISFDGNGVISIYSEDKWDFTPFSLSSNNEPKFDFLQILNLKDKQSDYERIIIEQIKYFLFLLIYQNRGGRYGSLSVPTLRRYFYVLAEIGRFCLENKKRDSLVEMSLYEVLSQKNLFSLYMRSDPKNFKKRPIIDTVNAVRGFSKEYLGFVTPKHKFNEVLARKHKQHPVIPTNIYLEIVNRVGSDLEFIESSLEGIEAFLAKFSDKISGRTLKGQKRKGTKVSDYQLTTPELIRKYNLGSLFFDKYEVHDLNSLVHSLYQIQYICLEAIVLFTGMRKCEALEMPLDCIKKKVLSPDVKDGGKVVIESEVIELVSFTTKHRGTRAVSTWLANSDVKSAINILKKINVGLSLCEGRKFFGHLFVSPNHIRGKSRPRTDFTKRHKPNWHSELIISAEDIDLMRVSNPESDLSDGKFAVGKAWNVTAHQYRRSLAYYAANSGFVSLSTLRVQFKHLTSLMTKYYTRHFEQINSIFGYFNPEKDLFEFPNGHTIFDFKEARTAFVIDALVEQVITTDNILYGKKANYIERQRSMIDSIDDDISLFEVRSKTEKAVRDGEIYYRETLLGGCTNPIQCDCRILGEFINCLSSSCAVIKPECVREQIEELTEYVALLEPSSGEREIVQEELNALIKYEKTQKRRIK
ncbi:hypothetical protein [Pseudoalteromonas ostreae]|uniref:hypothetical protein n=1 Tax=Pseudoalteromonas ostreae TaxID=2774154 RepID=UPI001B39C365|nr:hypothetical protein [Pseudoalteromonas ostreae]